MEWKENPNYYTMNIKKYIKYCFFLMTLWLLLVPSTSLSANDATDGYKIEKLNTKKFDTQTWKDVSANMKYAKKKKVEKKPKKVNPSTGRANTPRPTSGPPMSFRDFAQGVLIFLAVILLAFVIFKAVAGDAILSNKQVGRKTPISLEEIETNLEEADVEGFLKQALTNKDHRLAIRLYYLAILKELSLKRAIIWKKDKTNGHYMNEMRRSKHSKLQDFRTVTRIFEYVWYSDAQFDSGQFEEVRTDFKKLLTALK
jgi:hypothetical protein